MPSGPRTMFVMDPHLAFFQSLKREEVQLIALKEILYEGSWQEMIADLQARRGGKPYIFKLEVRIDEDLERIERLRDYELEHGVNLGVYVTSAKLVSDTEAT
jgi:hypothetical protein